MRYVEDSDGTIINGHKATEIQKIAHSIWVELANMGKAPKTWMGAGREVLDYYRSKLYQKVPQLRYCELDWKANQIAIDNYPSWYSNHFREPKVKKECIVPDMQDTSEPIGCKRSHQGTPIPVTRPVKKQKQISPDITMISQGNVPPLSTPKTRILHVVPSSPDHVIQIDGSPRLDSVSVDDDTGGVNPQMATIPASNIESDTAMATTTQTVENIKDNQAGPAFGAMKENSLAMKKTSKMRLGNLTTPRNLCACNWIKDHPHGTTEEYRIYYDNLDPQVKKVYQDHASQAAKAQVHVYLLLAVVAAH
ncbi:hypothetical protein SERLADRAFT_439795 [Serpula lacrymans var. lacrymans S7.9]|uniref:Uncharacterized protein n=1 Tax=Serpula lacrymans var. lacrymans (strain S7.9) TaxID=578457 RepID=F8P1K7_SERL9|nr:uncharacterized protein SERLADRAFT_439795 [Serpula lacrymans var. lacrymans S7.9]EGO23036.1 hypothetical protein SERLADRAFT_439795 [Serpula lacrymans var. lacrymans S7.9]